MASEERMIKLQQQVKQNNEDLQSMISGLGKWEEEMKYKERLARDKQAYEDGMEEIPPIRGREGHITSTATSSSSNNGFKKKQKTSHKPQCPKSKKPAADTSKHPAAVQQRIKSYDYAAWEKFDVDEAIKAAEEGDVEAASDCDCDREDGGDMGNLWREQQVKVERKKQEAMMLKDKGNEYFKDRKYDLAIECYSKAMQCDPVHAIFPANRAQAYIKQEKYQLAEEDCTLALSLDPTYTKAHFRRAIARLELAKLRMKHDNADNKFRMARDDFMTVLKYDPSNKQAQDHLRFIKEVLDGYKDEKSVIAATEYGANAAECEDVCDGEIVIKALDKPPECRSKKPLRKVVIDEIDGGYSNMATSTVEPAEASKVVASPSIINTQKTGNRTSDKESGKKYDTRLTKEKPATTISASASKPTSVPGLPQHSTQFLRDLKLLQPHRDMLYDYLKAIKPEQLPELFSEFFQKEHLSSLLNVFTEYFMPRGDDVYEYLRRLRGVKRFDMVMLFISEDDVNMLQTLLWHSVKYHDDGDVQVLADKYNVVLKK